MTGEERHPPPSAALGLRWAGIVRLPRPGDQYVVAPIRQNGTIDLANGVRDIWRDPDDADEVADEMERLRPDLDWHVWRRTITEFELDD